MRHLFVGIRPVQATDVEAILSILSEVACQIPVKLSTSEHVKRMKEQINRYCLDDVSLVAINENGVVIGFQLAERRSAEGFRCPDELYIYLAYAGVTAAAAGQKVFRQLIEAEKRFELPLVTEVKPDNKSDMAARLLHYKFQPYSSYDINGNYRWDPE
jgi:L-amino acid N-acyltransferase YncA